MGLRELLGANQKRVRGIAARFAELQRNELAARIAGLLKGGGEDLARLIAIWIIVNGCVQLAQIASRARTRGGRPPRNERRIKFHGTRQVAIDDHARLFVAAYLVELWRMRRLVIGVANQRTRRRPVLVARRARASPARSVDRRTRGEHIDALDHRLTLVTVRQRWQSIEDRAQTPSAVARRCVA
jgi:hypothetical protein